MGAISQSLHCIYIIKFCCIYIVEKWLYNIIPKMEWFNGNSAYFSVMYVKLKLSQ